MSERRDRTQTRTLIDLEQQQRSMTSQLAQMEKGQRTTNELLSRIEKLLQEIRDGGISKAGAA